MSLEANTVIAEKRDDNVGQRGKTAYKQAKQRFLSLGY